jgi:FkbM family methyltransferase
MKFLLHVGLLLATEVSWTVIGIHLCHWREAVYDSVKYKHCVRTEPDDVSNVIKSNADGVFQDCKILVKIWAKLNAGKPGDLFVDAGGNIGSCTLLMAAHGVHTVAFEPNPDNLFYLRSSVNANYNIAAITRVVGVGLADHDYSAPLFVEERNAGNSVVGQSFRTRKNPSHDINLRTLDSMLPSETSIPLMKMDVQGFELFVMKGARGLISRGVIKVIKLEVAELWLNAQNTTTAELYDFFAEHKYSVLNEEFEAIPRSEFIKPRTQYYDAVACLRKACASLQKK